MNTLILYCGETDRAEDDDLILNLILPVLFTHFVFCSIDAYKHEKNKRIKWYVMQRIYEFQTEYMDLLDNIREYDMISIHKTCIFL